MPFRSESQRRFLYSQKPSIAKRWRKESGPQTNLPNKVSDILATRKLSKKK